MPCSDGGVPYPPSKEEREAAKFAQRAPGMLCSAARALERLGYDFDENPELSDWWAKHKKEDDARIARIQEEELRNDWEKRVVRVALKKPLGDLTKEEKGILKKRGYI